MDGRAWNSGYQVTVDGWQSSQWVKSIREVTRIFNEHGIQVSHSKVYQIQAQRDDIEAGRPNARVDQTSSCSGVASRITSASAPLALLALGALPPRLATHSFERTDLNSIGGLARDLASVPRLNIVLNNVGSGSWIQLASRDKGTIAAITRP